MIGEPVVLLWDSTCSRSFEVLLEEILYLSGAVGSRRAKGFAVAIIGLVDVVERAKLEQNISNHIYKA